MVIPTGKGYDAQSNYLNGERILRYLNKLVFVVIHFNTTYSKCINMVLAGCMEQ